MIDGWDKKVDYHDKCADAEKISSAWEMDKKPVKRLPSETLFIKASKRKCKLYSRIWYPDKPDKNKFAIPRSPQISYVRNLKARLGPQKVNHIHSMLPVQFLKVISLLLKVLLKITHRRRKLNFHSTPCLHLPSSAPASQGVNSPNDCNLYHYHIQLTSKHRFGLRQPIPEAVFCI